MGSEPRSTATILSDPATLSSIMVGGIKPDHDLNPHAATDPNSDTDSFYVLSYLHDGDGRKFTVLFHLIVLHRSPGPASLLAMSVLDETSLLYFSNEYPDAGLRQTIIAPNALDIQVFSDPHQTLRLGYLSGTMNHLIVQGTLTKSGNKLDLDLALEAIGPTLPDLGSGVIPFPGGINYEFAFPQMNAKGILKVNGTDYEVTGSTWLDREWGLYNSAKWTWMGIDLENGVKISLWAQQNYQPNPQTYVGGRSFATILDGSGNVTLSTVQISEKSLEAASGAQPRYPNKWQVVIDGKCALKVETLKSGQNIESPIPRLEAKSHVTGTYEGKSVSGDAFVEAGILPSPQALAQASAASGSAGVTAATSNQRATSGNETAAAQAPVSGQAHQSRT